MRGREHAPSVATGCAGRATSPVARGRNGFTLIELLVALGVFSLAVVALLNVTGENTRTAVAVETRVLAGVVADNRAVEALTAVEPPPPGFSNGTERAGGRDWLWTRQVSATPDPAILRVDVRVAEAGRARTVAEVTLFRGRT